MDLRSIPDHPGYFADERGNIWSARNGGLKIRKVSPPRESDGYVTIPLSIDGKRMTRYVHRLVCAAHYGRPPKGTQVSHLNGDPSNNHPNNLAWETPKQNTGRKYRHGTMGLNAKLTAEDKHDIARLLSDGLLSQTEIGDMFDVSQAVVSRVRLQTFSPLRGNHKLSPEDLGEIRQLAESGFSQAKIGKLFGVTPSAIWRAKKRDYQFTR